MVGPMLCPVKSITAANAEEEAVSTTTAEIETNALPPSGSVDMEVEVSTATANVETNAVVPGCGTSAMAKAAAAANLYSR